MSARSGFCSVASRRRAESLYGSASRVKTWMLLEYPGVWQSNALAGSVLPEHVKKHLAAISASQPGLREVFIRQSHRRSDRMRCYLVESSERPPAILRLDLSICDELSSFDFGTIAGHPRSQEIEEPLFMVCTHGNHDKCCAKFGIPAYEKLKKLTGSQAWQCSHIGGDRFAGNLICLPHGLYYGHVSTENVKDIVDAYVRGEIWLPKFRGRSCYPVAAQVAEYFVRKESGRLGLNDFTYEGGTRTDAWVVRFKGFDGIHEVAFRGQQDSGELLTCKAEKPSPTTHYELLSYRVIVAV